jgi:hypothetical protein
MAPLTDRKRQLQAVWMKALTEDLVFRFRDKQTLHAAKFAFYNAVKPVRDNPGLNPALAEVLEQVALTTDTTKMTIRIGRSRLSLALDEVLSGLQLDVAVEPSPDLLAEESAARLQAAIAAEPTPDNVARIDFRDLRSKHHG